MSFSDLMLGAAGNGSGHCFGHWQDTVPCLFRPSYSVKGGSDGVDVVSVTVYTYICRLL